MTKYLFTIDYPENGELFFEVYGGSVGSGMHDEPIPHT